MTPFDQLLVGLTLLATAFAIGTWLAWGHEIRRHHETKDSRDMLRNILRDLGTKQRTREHGDALLSVTTMPRRADRLNRMMDARDEQRDGA